MLVSPFTRGSRCVVTGHIDLCIFILQACIWGLFAVGFSGYTMTGSSYAIILSLEIDKWLHEEQFFIAKKYD